MTLTPQDYRKTEFIHRQGLAADRPPVTDVLVGTLYFSTDTLSLERSDGTNWTAYSGTGAIPGPVGPAGPPGSIGPQGGQGSPGVDGSDGEDGAMGSPGPIGPRGFAGIQGIAGPIGPIGENGLDGEMGFPGPMGARGIQGLQGIQGIMGPVGFDGEDGQDGFPIVGPIGPRGIQGPAGTGGGSSIPGFLSFDGMDGEEGFPTIGIRGPTGATGSQGIQGLRGFQGAPGFDGEDGIEPMMMMLGASGGGIPALPLQSVQFNDGGKLAGHSGMLYDKTDSTLGVGNFITSGDGYVVGNFAVEGIAQFGIDKVQAGLITATGGDASLSGPGIDFYVSTDPMRWSMIAEKSMYGTKKAIYFKDRLAGKIPLVLHEHPTVAGNYVLAPHPNSGPILSLGDATLHPTNQRIATIYSSAIDSIGLIQTGTNFYEKGRSVALGHAADWVPTFTGLTIGSGTVIAKEARVGTITLFAILLLFAADTVVTGNVAFTIPRPSVTIANSQSIARIMALFAAGGTFYGGQSWLASSTEHYVMFHGSPLVNMGPTVPFAWGVNSQLFIQGWFAEA